MNGILIVSTKDMEVIGMRNMISFKLLSAIIAGFLLFLPLTNTYAKAGCCSSHGGVAGCDKSSNMDLCKDGTNSPSCTCDGSTTKPAKVAKATPAAAAAAPATTETTTTKTTKTSTKGCCSGHGGVKKCDTASGFQMCKDGTKSSTCACSK
jgi:hypothetical protein